MKNRELTQTKKSGRLYTYSLPKQDLETPNNHQTISTFLKYMEACARLQEAVIGQSLVVALTLVWTGLMAA